VIQTASAPSFGPMRHRTTDWPSERRQRGGTTL